MVNAIPRLMREFAVPATSAQWLSTAFMLTMAVVIPATGWFLQRVTTRTAYALAMGLFLTGTALATLAPTFTVLLVARVVQASGTAVMMPLLMTTMMTLVPPQERGKVMGNVTLVMSVAPALGPAVSGLLLRARLVAADLRRRAAHRGRRRHPGAARAGQHRRHPPAPGSTCPASSLSAIGFGALVYGLSGLGDGGRATHTVPPAVVTAIGVLALVAFVRRQIVLQRGTGALLDLRTLTFAPVRRLARRDVPGLHGDDGRDDPAAALPAGRPAPQHPDDRAAAHARRARDGAARPGRRSRLRPVRRPAPRGPRRGRDGGRRWPSSPASAPTPRRGCCWSTTSR